MADAYGTSYNGGGGGGSSGGGQNFGSPEGGEKQRKPTDEKTVIPTTIKMLLSASKNPDMRFDDGRETDLVKLVAAVRDVNLASTSNTYRVEDGTGLIQMREWVDGDNNGEEMDKMRQAEVVENTYVRIFGKLSHYEGVVQIIGHSVRKVSSGNEITHHFLEVVHAAESYKKSSSIVGSPTPMNMNMAVFNGQDAMVNGNGMHSSTPIGKNAPVGDGDEFSEEITAFLRNVPDSMEGGGDINDFLKIHEGRYSREVVLNKFEELCNDGIIYSTTDDDHYTLIDG